MISYYRELEEYLAGLSFHSATIDEIMKCYRVRKYKKDEFFATSGEISDKLGFVIDGLFHMNIIKQDGTIFIKQFMKKKEFLLASFGPFLPSEVNIQALKNSTILEAKYSEVQALFHKYQELELSGSRRMEAEVDKISKRMVQFATLDAKARYLEFQEEFKESEQEIPQYLIASYLGVTPTQLSRIRLKIKSSDQHM